MPAVCLAGTDRDCLGTIRSALSLVDSTFIRLLGWASEIGVHRRRMRRFSFPIWFGDRALWTATHIIDL